MDSTNSSHDSESSDPLSSAREELSEEVEPPLSPCCMDMELPDCGISPDSSSYTYHSATLISQAFSKMKELRDNDMLCDVVLVVGSKRISAHRLVLASTFDYFSPMFTQVKT